MIEKQNINSQKTSTYPTGDDVILNFVEMTLKINYARYKNKGRLQYFCPLDNAKA